MIRRNESQVCLGLKLVLVMIIMRIHGAFRNWKPHFQYNFSLGQVTKIRHFSSGILVKIGEGAPYYLLFFQKFVIYFNGKFLFLQFCCKTVIFLGGTYSFVTHMFLYPTLGKVCKVRQWMTGPHGRKEIYLY